LHACFNSASQRCQRQYCRASWEHPALSLGDGCSVGLGKCPRLHAHPCVNKAHSEWVALCGDLPCDSYALASWGPVLRGRRAPDGTPGPDGGSALPATLTLHSSILSSRRKRSSSRSLAGSSCSPCFLACSSCSFSSFSTEISWVSWLCQVLVACRSSSRSSEVRIRRSECRDLTDEGCRGEGGTRLPWLEEGLHAGSPHCWAPVPGPKDPRIISRHPLLLNRAPLTQPRFTRHQLHPRHRAKRSPSLWSRHFICTTTLRQPNCSPHTRGLI
jgi:hypothetical protein